MSNITDLRRKAHEIVRDGSAVIEPWQSNAGSMVSIFKPLGHRDKPVAKLMSALRAEALRQSRLSKRTAKRK
jgi:hypothetical protein